jgi:excinuclease ABC subunit A
MHMLKAMDYLIDLGPDGGEKGGYVLASGEPEDIIRNEKSITGKYLKEYLKK